MIEVHVKVGPEIALWSAWAERQLKRAVDVPETLERIRKGVAWYVLKKTGQDVEVSVSEDCGDTAVVGASSEREEFDILMAANTADIWDVYPVTGRPKALKIIGETW